MTSSQWADTTSHNAGRASFPRGPNSQRKQEVANILNTSVCVSICRAWPCIWKTGSLYAGRVSSWTTESIQNYHTVSDWDSHSFDPKIWTIRRSEFNFQLLIPDGKRGWGFKTSPKHSWCVLMPCLALKVPTLSSWHFTMFSRTTCPRKPLQVRNKDRMGAAA